MRNRAYPMQITREGNFKIDPSLYTEGNVRCGLRKTPFEYSYKATFRGVDVKPYLPEYFIIDNAEVHQYFIDEYELSGPQECISCEAMACRAVDHFRYLFTEGRYKDIGIDEIIITINPGKFSGITVCWAKEKQPSFAH